MKLKYFSPLLIIFLKFSFTTFIFSFVTKPDKLENLSIKPFLRNYLQETLGFFLHKIFFGENMQKK